MNDVLVMAVAQGAGQLRDILPRARSVNGRVARSQRATNTGGLPIAEVVLALQFLIQFAARCILENQIDPVVIVKVAKHAQDIRVPQVRLDLNLAPELMLDAIFQ